MLIDTAGESKYFSMASVIKGGNVEIRFWGHKDKKSVGVVHKGDQIMIPPNTHFMVRNNGDVAADLIFIVMEGQDEEEEEDEEDEDEDMGAK